MVLLISALLILVGCGNKEEPQQVEEKTVPVEVVTAAKTNLNKELEMTGEIIAGTDVSIASKLSGKVAGVYVKTGQFVNQGTVLFELENSSFEIALRTAETNLENAQKNYDRTKQLYKLNAVSQVEFEQAETKLKLQQAQYDSALENYNDTKVTAPITGKVSFIDVDKGEMVSPQMPVAGVVDLNTVKVKLDVSENLVASLKEGQKVSVHVDALGKIIEGKIRSISPKIDKATRAFPVEIAIANPDGEILAGMVSRIKIPTEELKDVIVIPADALLEHNGMKKIYVVEKGTAKERLVKAGVTSIDKVQILEGLAEGEKVIVTGNRLVGDGQKVDVIKTASVAGGEK
ncbi:MAG: efflux RND transporter periplasmic adaptor subunit [Firmicutes bacterium]|nr:efflux RND transporter periplasmic adaptor subunit [Bacillota bacterium]